MRRIANGGAAVGELEDPAPAASVADSSRAATPSGVTASNAASASSASIAISTRFEIALVMGA